MIEYTITLTAPLGTALTRAETDKLARRIRAAVRRAVAETDTFVDVGEDTEELEFTVGLPRVRMWAELPGPGGEE